MTASAMTIPITAVPNQSAGMEGWGRIFHRLRPHDLHRLRLRMF